MNNIAVFGQAWGDEAKSRFIHWMCQNDKSYPLVVARFGGSENAGHTLYDNGQKIVRHYIPSADFNSNNKAFLGSGMVINLDTFLSEVQDTLKLFPNAASSIIVDPDAFIILPKHIEEDKEKNKHIGSTNKGVSPAYRDKTNRCGLKVRDFINAKDERILKLMDLGVQFKYALEIKDLLEKSRIIFEGSQSILLDSNYGTYPYVTSGECGMNGIYSAGLGFVVPSTVYGIFKAYSTKVGEGPFPTEYFGEEANAIQTVGLEKGSTTGRLRRVGALDLPVLKYSALKGGINSLVITKLDVLNGYDKIKVCYDYQKPIYSGQDLIDNTPLYTELPGWKDARNIKQIKPLLNYIETQMELPIKYVSVGVNKEDMFPWH